MEQPTPEFQIQFLKNIQRLLAEGRFTASYKYALLLSLADIAVERGDESGRTLTVPTRAIAEKFIQYYWRQALPYVPRQRSAQRKVLQQNTDRRAKIVTLLSDAYRAHGGSLSAAAGNAKAWKSLVSQAGPKTDGRGASFRGPYDSHQYPVFTRLAAYNSRPSVLTLMMPGNSNLNRFRAVSLPVDTVKSKPSIVVPSAGSAVSPSPTNVAAISVENTSGRVEREARPRAPRKLALGCPWSGTSPEEIVEICGRTASKNG